MDFADLLSEYGLYLSYILLAVAALAAIVLPLINALNDPQSLIKVGIGIAALIIVFLIGYALSGSEVPDSYAAYNVTTENASKLIGGALTTMYLLVAIALVGIIVSEASKAFK